MIPVSRIHTLKPRTPTSAPKLVHKQDKAKQDKANQFGPEALLKMLALKKMPAMNSLTKLGLMNMFACKPGYLHWNRNK